MAESLLDKYAIAETGSDPLRQALYTVNLVRGPREQVAFSYSQLLWADLTLAADCNSIILHFSTHTVHLRGYCLQPLYAALIRHSKEEIRVSSVRHAAPDQGESVVIQIDVVEVRPKGEPFPPIGPDPSREGD